MRWVLPLVLLAGCHNMSPPPLLMRHAGAQPDGLGDTRIQLVFGLNAGVLSVDPGLGVALQLSHQTTERWKFGGNLGVGFNVEHLDDDNKNQHPTWLIGGRGFGRYHFEDADLLASEAGLGLGYTGNETVYLTTDVGGTFGGRSDLFDHDGDIFYYLAPSFAVSVPIVEGRPILERPFALGPAHGPPSRPPPREVYPRTTWFFALALGTLGEHGADDAVGWSLELHQFIALDERDGSYNLGFSMGPSGRVSD